MALGLSGFFGPLPFGAVVQTDPNSHSQFTLTTDVAARAEKIIAAGPMSFAAMARLGDLDPLTDFRGLTLAGIDLGGEDLCGVDFSGADLRGCNIRGTTIDATTRFDDARLDEEDAAFLAQIVIVSP
ncbi:pentapeptide repeat-containing protein [Methylosinus sp. LW3]|uniref:pentapeptide repeat-containing protein n=1 Tax=Methylosinus sp. LW3 TaxID=107635 RepID=UPI000464FF64|nr:pentapeptide repeat-containing protein [Methylosinus sp. LW3]